MHLLVLLLPMCSLALLTPEGVHGGEQHNLEQIKIDLTPQIEEPLESLRAKRQVAKVGEKWASNTVYYYFGPAVNERKRKSVRAAIADLQSRTCINFVENAKASNRIRFVDGYGCRSDLGMLRGEQQIVLADGCESVGTAAQQLVHVLGLAPTHLRNIRDQYITIDPSAANKYPVEDSLIFARYEYGSIMHGPASTVKNATKPILVPVEEQYLHTMGSEFVSFYDIQAINQFYGCNGVPQCKNKGVPNGNDGRTCDCPDGYGGPLCDQRPGNCGQTLLGTPAWKNHEITVGNTARPNFIRQQFTKCVTWITAPQGKQIVVKINKIASTECSYGCTMGGLEIKGEWDQAITNPRYCCKEFVGTVVKSQLNPTPIIFYSRKGASTFNVAYQYV